MINRDYTLIPGYRWVHFLSAHTEHAIESVIGEKLKIGAKSLYYECAIVAVLKVGRSDLASQIKEAAAKEKESGGCSRIKK